MNANAQKIKELLTKFNLHVDEMYNGFDVEYLILLGKASVTLVDMLECEERIVTSETVKYIVKDDITRVKENLKVIKSTIRLKSLNLEDFCPN
jgi:hypothetical protein